MAERRLKKVADVRRYLASIITRLEERYGAELDATIAGRLAYISNVLLGAIRESDIEERIARIERCLGGKLK